MFMVKIKQHIKFLKFLLICITFFKQTIFRTVLDLQKKRKRYFREFPHSPVSSFPFVNVLHWYGVSVRVNEPVFDNNYILFLMCNQ